MKRIIRVFGFLPLSFVLISLANTVTLELKAQALSPTINSNYVIEYNVTTIGKVDQASVYNANNEEVDVTISYKDGLGRELQRLNVQSSPNSKDVVIPMEYDKLGRPANNYLPYVSDGHDGGFRANALKNLANTSQNDVEKYRSGEQYKFYQVLGSSIQADQYPYSVTTFEPSSLSRPIKMSGPGADWVNNNKAIAKSYSNNIHDVDDAENESIVAWKVDADGLISRCEVQSGYIETGGYYSSGQLQITITTNEEGFTVREYYNKQGLMVLKKVQVIENAALNNNEHWAQTYYVYDSLDNLALVLPPQATSTILE